MAAAGKVAAPPGSAAAQHPSVRQPQNLPPRPSRVSRVTHTAARASEEEGGAQPRKGERISANHLSAGALMTELATPRARKATATPFRKAESDGAISLSLRGR